MENKELKQEISEKELRNRQRQALKKLVQKIINNLPDETPLMVTSILKTQSFSIQSKFDKMTDEQIAKFINIAEDIFNTIKCGSVENA